MDPGDEQDLRAHDTAARPASAADDDLDVKVLGWTAAALFVLAVLTTRAAVSILGDGFDPTAEKGLTLAAVALFLLVGSAVCAISGAVKSAELRIRRDR